MAQTNSDKFRGIVCSKAILLTRRDCPDYRLCIGMNRCQQQLTIPLKIIEQLSNIEHRVAI